MKYNVGTTDRSIRLLIGLLCVYLSLMPNPAIDNEILRIFVAIFGVGNLIVSLVRFCPLYTLADIDTRDKKTKSS